MDSSRVRGQAVYTPQGHVLSLTTLPYATTMSYMYFFCVLAYLLFCKCMIRAHAILRLQLVAVRHTRYGVVCHATTAGIPARLSAVRLY